ncbi:MAG: zinc-binding dehydrogenase [Deltaproteobacteria bacterium]|nr:zinc-binding dehydrogenase [Nannocystaceae bacterium]
MRQVWIPRIGGPEVLTVRELPDPEPAAGELRVRVRNCGVNFADVLARLGLYPDAPPLPAVVGYEVAGEVDALGEGTTGFALGQRVIAMTRFGGYTDVVCVPTGQVVAMPERLSFEQAAAIPVNYLTAWLMLIELGALAEHHTVLVHAAAGGVGQAALQICRTRGAKVIASASVAKHDRLREQGVHACIDSRADNLVEAVRGLTDGRGVDIVLDAIGGRSFRDGYALLAPLGRMFMFGVSSFAPGKTRSLVAAVRGVLTMPRFGSIRLMNDNRGVFGVNLGHLWNETAFLQRALGRIIAHCESGEFVPTVDRSFPFDQAGDAHAHLQGRGSFGKVLLHP